MAKQQSSTGASDEQQSSTGASAKYTVTAPFRDVGNFEKQYSIGDDVTHFDKERLENLVKNKLAEFK